MTENRSAVIIVNAKGESVPVTLLVDVDGTGGGNEPGDDPDEPSLYRAMLLPGCMCITSLKVTSMMRSTA